MLQFGIDPRTAIATNMFALIFLSVGGTLPFLSQNLIDRKRLPLLIGLTLAGSFVGAWLVLVLPSKTMPFLISVSMIGVTIFSIAKRDMGVVTATALPSRAAERVGYGLTFTLGIYGGFFSGGYVTMLTAVYIALFQMTFVEAVAITKLLNIFSSLVATLIFIRRGLVDYQLGLILGVTMFFGAMLGARLALRMSNIWLRRIFLTTVIVLAIKTLLQWLSSN